MRAEAEEKGFFFFGEKKKTPCGGFFFFFFWFFQGFFPPRLKSELRGADTSSVYMPRASNAGPTGHTSFEWCNQAASVHS